MCSRRWANDEAPEGWEGLGLAVQAYQKRALPLIAWLTDLARRQRRIIPVRLVKGAYWDSEIKRGQELGLTDYPVFTRKIGTDISYLACARALLAAPHLIFPQFATHNAHTLAAVETFAGDEPRISSSSACTAWAKRCTSFMTMSSACAARAVATRIYAPVGSHEDLLVLSRATLAGERRQHIVRQSPRQ